MCSSIVSVLSETDAATPPPLPARVCDTAAMLTLGSVVIRVTDLEAQVAFWSAALDYTVREAVDTDFVLLRSADGRGPNVGLDQLPSERALPPRIHLDLYADDQAAEVARLEDLGARVVPWAGRPDDADYIVMEDPEGTRFCVIDTAPRD